jgi:hypothetical protein
MSAKFTVVHVFPHNSQLPTHLLQLSGHFCNDVFQSDPCTCHSSLATFAMMYFKTTHTPATALWPLLQ